MTFAERLKVFQDDARACTTCHAVDLVHVHEKLGHAKPMLQRSPTGALGILIVAEAPNWGDTYDPKKGHLTYEKDTDQTGRFMWQLLTEEVGLREDEINDVLFTNAVLCLPTGRDKKYPVKTKQLDLCQPWLVRLIEDAGVKVVVAMGGKALEALSRVEPHGLTLSSGVGRMHPWRGRLLLPLYHSSVLGRNSRSAELQRQDIRPLRGFLGR